MGPVRRSREGHGPTRNHSHASPGPIHQLVISLIAALSGVVASAQDFPDLISTVIRGSTVYGPGELFEVYGKHLGSPITRQSAEAITTDLARKYTDDGYARPAIRIDDRMASVGVLGIEVVETRISGIEVSGDPGPYAPRLEMLGRQLSNDTAPLRNGDLQSAIRRLSSLPGLRLTAATSRDAELPGAYRLNLDTDFSPLSGTLRLSDRGTDEIGPGFVLGQINYNGLFGGRSSAGLLFGAATDHDEYRGAGLSATTLIGPRDSRIAVSAYRSHSNPDEPIHDRNDHYLRDRASFSAAVPLSLEASRELTLTAGLRAEDLEIDRAGLLFRNERLRLLEIGFRRLDRGPRAEQLIGVELVRGLDALGSGLTALDLSNDPRRVDFLSINADYVRAARLHGSWTWRLNALAQVSDDVLPYTERFKIGGDRIGRGFEVPSIAGDSGIGAKVEFIRRLDRIPDRVGVVSVYSLYDIGATWKNDAPGRESATTAGIGLSLNGENLSGRLELAKPLIYPDIEGREEARLFFEITTSW